MRAFFIWAKFMSVCIPPEKGVSTNKKNKIFFRGPKELNACSTRKFSRYDVEICQMNVHTNNSDSYSTLIQVF